MSLRCCGLGLIVSLVVLTLLTSTFDRHEDRTNLLAMVTSPAVPSGESLYQLPSVWTTDAGSRLKLEQLKGGTRVLAMMFTHCTSLCPTLVRDLKALDAAMPAKTRATTEYVLVTIDPDHDDAATLHEFRARMGLDPKRFLLLRGNAHDTQELAAVLGFNYGKGDGRNYTHSNLVTVLDGQGAIVHQQIGLGQDLSRAVATIEETRAR
jgi:protein SCO1/2